MTQVDFSAKWDRRFKDNTDFIISEADLREFKDDCLLVFGAGANPGASAQLLGLDPATGEFLVLLSPSAPKTESSYTLAEYAAPPGAGYALRPLPAGSGLASRILRLPASVAGKTLCLLDANGLPVPLQHLERLPATIWHYVGDPSLQSISLGPLDLTSNSFDPSGLDEVNVFYGAQFVQGNTVGPDFSGNHVYGQFSDNEIGANCSGNTFRGSFTHNKVGINVNRCYFDTDTDHVEIGDGCERNSFYNCKGTPQQPFVVPAGTTDATFRNNQLVNKADEDGRFSLISPTDPAVPESAVRGSINWRYEVAPATGQWELKPGKSVMFGVGSGLTFPADVQEGDIFGVYINPASATTRIVLNVSGGIDEQPTRRYTKGTSLVFRYTYYADYTDPTSGKFVAAHYGLQTLQQTTPKALNNRGAFAPSTYYLPGDVVTFNGALYLRQVEGSDTGAFDPTKWVGGGGAAASGSPLVNSTVLHFDKSYTHAPIASGTFTTDTSTVQVNSEVSVILAATATDPAANGGLPAATFQLLAGAYAKGVELLYTFRAGSNGKIQYVINQLP